ncbi:MAG: S8 family serine peptidase [Proteobacteria bacterium]|nr:S8 family serine peptidase [Pseudomonadota bacterium]
MLKRKKPVIVGVVDYHLDIHHPVIAGSLHQNPNEVDGDNIDNDGNLCRDDIFGCDFNDVEGLNLHFNPRDRKSNTPRLYDKFGCSPNLFRKIFTGVTFQGINSANRVNSVEPSGHATSVTSVIAHTKLPDIKIVFVEEQHVNPGVSALSLQYMAHRGVSVINISNMRERPDCYFCPPGPPDLTDDRDFIDCATKLNITLVVAAGNENCDLERCQEFNPVGLPISNMIVVGAARDNRITVSSNYRGPVQIAAVVPPLVAMPCSNSIWFNQEVCCYASRTGTSLSAPVVTRVFAEIQLQRPDLSLTAKEFTDLVIETGIKPENYAEKPMIILDPKKLAEKLGIQLTVDDQHCYGIHGFIEYLCSTILHPVYYIPAAILYGLFSDAIFEAIQKFFSLKYSKNSNPFSIPGVFLETYLRTLLPWPASIIENMSRAFGAGFVESYNKQGVTEEQNSKEAPKDRYKVAAKAGLWKLPQATLIVGATWTIPFGAQIYNFTSAALRRFYSTPTPSKGTFFSRVKDSVSAGVSHVFHSIPGAGYIYHANQEYESGWKRYCKNTHLSWRKHLENNALLKDCDDDGLRLEFEKWLQSKTEKYLSAHPNVNAYDILLPSYDEVLAVETSKLHFQ